MQREKKIDVRGLACPAPVLRTKDTIEKERPALIRVIVDNEAAKENVIRFLESQQFAVTAIKQRDGFEVVGERQNDIPPEVVPAKAAEHGDKKIMVMISTDRMGHGDDGLGSRLMENFLKTLLEMGKDLWLLIFLNNGVKLTIKDSEVISILKNLEKEGVQILVCGTCLAHFDLLDQKGVGETTNMLDIVTAMQLADRVINI